MADRVQRFREASQARPQCNPATGRIPAAERATTDSLRQQLWLVFLDRLGVDLDEASVEHVSRFGAWLRAPAENMAMCLRACVALVDRHRPQSVRHTLRRGPAPSRAPMAPVIPLRSA